MGNSKSQQPYNSYNSADSVSDTGAKRQKFARQTRHSGLYPHERDRTSRYSSSSSGIYPHISTLVRDPILFHDVHGINISISDNGKIASRTNSFCFAIAFTSRPLEVQEKIYFNLKRVNDGWSGVMRFGFTSNDPSRLQPRELPRYACPDLTNQPGYWAKAMPEKFAKQNNVLSFYVNTQGCVFYAVNDKLEGKFFEGVDVTKPLWGIVDIYGNTTALEIIDKYTQNSSNRPNSVSEEIDEASSMSPVISLPHNMEAAVRRHFHVTVPITQIGFSATMGRQLRCRNRKLLTRKRDMETESSVAFTNLGLKPGQTVYMYCAEKNENGLFLEEMRFGIGITTCDPTTVYIPELPFDSAMLGDRSEYWIIYKEFEPPEEKEYFAVTVEKDGYLSYTRQDGQKEILFYMDVSQPLYLVFDLCSTISAIALVGMSTEAESSNYYDVAPLPRSSYLNNTPESVEHAARSIDNNIADDIFASLNLLETFSNATTVPIGPIGDSLDLYNAVPRSPLSTEAEHLQEEDEGEASGQIQQVEDQSSSQTAESNVTDTVDTDQAIEVPEPGERGLSIGEIAGFSAPLMLGALSWIGERVRNRLQQNDVAEADIVVLDSSSSSSSDSDMEQDNDEDSFRDALADAESSESSDDDDMQNNFSLNSRLLEMLNHDLTELLRPIEMMDDIQEISPLHSLEPPGAVGGSLAPGPSLKKNNTEEQPGSLDPSKECVICCDKTVNAVVYACGHACMCIECAKFIKQQRNPTCPICRARVKDIIQIYHA